MMIDVFSSKRSQAEAFGLILIVALVFVIFIIMVRVEQTRSPSEVAQEYEVNILSSSAVNTFLTTDATECGRGKTFSDVARDCAVSQESSCGETGITNCDYFVNQMNDIFEEVFDRIGLDYQVRFDAEGITLPEALHEPKPSNVECAEGLSGEEFRRPMNPGELVINLVVCKP
ncbi:MAG: hypothetical protein ACLFSL_04480 [Candidatus Woesearchaeota archaeon]